METLAYLHLAFAYEASLDTTPSFPLETLTFFEWLKRQKLATYVRIYLLSLVAILSILGMAGEALAEKALKLGDYDPEVTFIQQRLRQLGYFNQSPRRYFDSATRNAVIRFQQDRGLPVDGIAGSQTQDALFAEFQPRKQISTEEFSYDNSNYDSSSYDSSTSLVLRQGDRGSNVRLLQRRLREEGFYFGSIDGFFGYSTEVAVRQFQDSKGLSSDGIAGQDTLAALGFTDQVATGRREPREITLGLGSRGSRVKALQRKLSDSDFYFGQIDGIFGSQTETAVRQFQGANGLSPTGIADSDTLTALGIREPEQKRYVVVVPVRDEKTLDEVRAVRGFGNASVDQSKRGRYVNAGAFSNRALAESRSYLLRSRGLDARVAYAP